MRIAEIFYSIQGEGRLAGLPSVFIRTSGCNLRCVWCDTPYTSWNPEGEEWTVQEILGEVRRYPSPFVVITGGEPLIARGIEDLAAGLKQKKRHITIETAATIFKPVVCDLVSMSPKLAHSTPWKREQGKFARIHEGQRLNFGVIRDFIDRYDYQLKFVVEEKKDFAEIRGILRRLKNVDPSHVLVMAQARTKRELRARAPGLIDLCKSHGFRYSPRLHIDLYGNRRGT